VVIVLFVLSALWFALWHFFYRNKKHKQQKITYWLPEEKIEKKVPRPSAVYVFGDFIVYDAKGKDISYRFSMKLRALFLLLLLNTTEEAGISTEKLTSTLWSDKDTNSAKNIRGVTINRLRNILEDIDGISLVHQNHQWFFVFESPFYCDYLEYSDILQRLQNSDQGSYPDLLEQVVALVKNGSFLSNVHDVGLDNYKAREEEKLEKLLREYVIYLYGEKQYQKVISISGTYFSVEPLNDEVFNICVKSFNKLGKKEEAKTFLNNYKRNHKILTGEDYQV
jgi:two-component SAPR family response regulator